MSITLITEDSQALEAARKHDVEQAILTQCERNGGQGFLLLKEGERVSHIFGFLQETGDSGWIHFFGDPGEVRLMFESIRAELRKVAL